MNDKYNFKLIKFYSLHISSCWEYQAFVVLNIIWWPSLTFNIYLFISEQIAHHSNLSEFLLFHVNIIYTFNLHSILQEIFPWTPKFREISTKLLCSDQLFCRRHLNFMTKQLSHRCNSYNTGIYSIDIVYSSKAWTSTAQTSASVFRHLEEIGFGWPRLVSAILMEWYYNYSCRSKSFRIIKSATRFRWGAVYCICIFGHNLQRRKGQ